MSKELRITFAEAELIQRVIRDQIAGYQTMLNAGVRDTVAVVQFMGVGGCEMDEIEESQFKEVFEEKIIEMQTLAHKLKHIFGI